MDLKIKQFVGTNDFMLLVMLEQKDGFDPKDASWAAHRGQVENILKALDFIDRLNEIKAKVKEG